MAAAVIRAGDDEQGSAIGKNPEERRK